jgi:hypothetical protein
VNYFERNCIGHKNGRTYRQRNCRIYPQVRTASYVLSLSPGQLGEGEGRWGGEERMMREKDEERKGRERGEKSKEDEMEE